MWSRQKDANNKPNEQIQIQLFRTKVSASGKAYKVKTCKYDRVSSNTKEKRNQSKEEKMRKRERAREQKNKNWKHV